jgi:hypothetical protein
MRKSADLLDLFRSGGAAKQAAAPRKAPAVRSSGGGGVSVSLSRRQATLAACAAALVLVLAFVAGIAVGRGRHAGGQAPVAARLVGTPHALTSAPIPRVGLRGENLLPIVLADLLDKHPELDGRVQVVPPEEAPLRERGYQCLRVVGFPDRATAQAVQIQLAVWGYTGAGYPFQTSAPEADRR